MFELGIRISDKEIADYQPDLLAFWKHTLATHEAYCGRFEATWAKLQATEAKLKATQAELEATQAKLKATQAKPKRLFTISDN